MKSSVTFGIFQIELNDSYLRGVHDRLEANLNKMMAPLNSYLAELDEEYSGLYSEELVYEINMFIDENHTFEEVVEKREHFQVRRLKKKKKFKRVNTVDLIFSISVLREQNQRHGGQPILSSVQSVPNKFDKYLKRFCFRFLRRFAGRNDKNSRSR